MRGWGGRAKCNRDKRYALHGPEDMAPTALPGLSPLREAEGLEGGLGVQGLGAPGMGGAIPGGWVQSIGEAPSLPPTTGSPGPCCLLRILPEHRASLSPVRTSAQMSCLAPQE